MSEEQLKAFLKAARADAWLEENLKAAGDADAVVAITKEAGFVARCLMFISTHTKTFKTCPDSWHPPVHSNGLGSENPATQIQAYFNQYS